MRNNDIRSALVAIEGGVKLYYEERGNGPVLLFIHGLWGSSRFFRPQLEFFGDHYRAIAVDLRGSGRSTMSSDNQTIPTYARDLRKFVEALGLVDFVAVGWSMGAFVCWDYYSQFGVGGMRGLVVVDQPPSDWPSAAVPNALLSVDALREWHYQLLTDKTAFMRNVIPMMFAVPPAADDAQWMLDEMTLAPAVVAAAVMIDQSLRDYQHMLWDYPVPTLVCGGGHSAQPRGGLELIVDRIRDGRLIIFESSGHCLFLEEADRFNAAVEDFVRPLYQ